MNRHKLLSAGIMTAIIVAALGHFVPVYDQKGLLDTGNHFCVGYTAYAPQYHRLIPEGKRGFDHDRQHFTADDAWQPLSPDDQASPCGIRPVILRLYVW